MTIKQLDTLYRFEQDKEHKAAQRLQQAEQDYQQNIQRLQSVSDFRLEYMKRLSQRCVNGIDSATYTHFHAFITKLDNASEQVKVAIRQAKALVAQTKKHWLEQRQKLQAVEHLRDKKRVVLLKKANKQEQQMFDEIATQQFIRRRMT